MRGEVETVGGLAENGAVQLGDWLELAFMALVAVRYAAYRQPSGRYLVAILAAASAAIIL